MDQQTSEHELPMTEQRATTKARGGDTMTETETDERPWYTVDMVVLRGTEVLLIERGDEPYKGRWALPGGYVSRGETSRDAAARELLEETGVQALPELLTQVGVFDTPDRDPRGRVVSVAYVIEVDAGTIARAGDDAAAVRWVPLEELADLQGLAFDHGLILQAAITP